MSLENYDDKDLAIVAIAALGIIGGILVAETSVIITGAITAIAALATGRKL